MNSQKFKYDYLRYNQYFVLRANTMTIMILCYLCKDIFLVIGIGATAFKGKGGDVSNVMGLVSPIFFFSAIPAILVAYALLVRLPQAGNVPRMIWKKGRILIALSASTHIFLLGFLLKWNISNMILTHWIAVFVDLAIIGYIISSEFIKDLFSEFPERKI